MSYVQFFQNFLGASIALSRGEYSMNSYILYGRWHNTIKYVTVSVSMGSVCSNQYQNANNFIWTNITITIWKKTFGTKVIEIHLYLISIYESQLHLRLRPIINYQSIKYCTFICSKCKQMYSHICIYMYLYIYIYMYMHICVSENFHCKSWPLRVELSFAQYYIITTVNS